MNYYPKSFNGSFLTDDVLIYKDEYNNLIHATIDNQTLDKKIWVKNISFVGIFTAHLLLKLIKFFFQFKICKKNEWGGSTGSKYSVSADFKYVLFPYDSRPVYRHSAKSKYRIIDIEQE